MAAERLSRRELIRLLGASALAAWPAGAISRDAEQLLRNPSSSPRPRVALVRCSDYRPENLAAALGTGWGSSRPPDVRGKRVVIKPNLVEVSPDRPINTDPRLVEALVLHIRGLGAREIVLAEGAAHNRDSESLFRRSGYEALAERLDVRLVDLNYDDVRPVKCVNPKATFLKDLFLPETVLSADIVISVPKLKTHRHAGVTLSLKNMFGIVPGMKYGWPKNVLHWNGIPLSICEVNGTFKSHYSIVDGVIGMEGHGPLLGTARKAGVLVMGDNALAVDATAARVMGVDPARVEHLGMAHKIKLGSLRREDIEVTGQRVEQARTDFVLDPEYAFLRAPKG